MLSQVNVFELGHTYLQLVQTLNLRLPLVDPSHYISRFAALLEFGDETHKVSTDAIRLVQRFDRDWMTKGRRPSGICGAALFLAARMNNFRRSVEEIVQVVKIADTTVKKRLEEFKGTSSAGLTVGDFRRVWLEEECDPPAFAKGKEKEEEEKAGGTKKKAKKKKKKRKRGDEEEDTEEEEEEEEPKPWDLPQPPRAPIDPALLNDGILKGTTDPPPLFVPEQYDDPAQDPSNMNIDPSLLPQRRTPSPTCLRSPEFEISPTFTPPPTTIVDETANTVLTEEVSTFLQNTQGALLSSALDEAQERRLNQIQNTVVDELIGLDEEELDRFLLTEEEVKIKERVWVEMNKEYLENLAGGCN
jgi:transcription factor IIIB 90 kDa subunit